jgi:hypothetical protein
MSGPWFGEDRRGALEDFRTVAALTQKVRAVLDAPAVGAGTSRQTESL